jgi:phosphoesterase RecJ-like protein
LIVPRDVLSFLQKEGAFLILGHAEPDADCLGSQIALAQLIQQLGGKTILCSPGPFLRSEIRSWEPLFQVRPREFFQSFDFVVVLDCSVAERTGDWQSVILGKPTLVIDHHSSGTSFGNLTYLDTTSPSTALLVYRIYQASRIPIDPVAAFALMMGSCTDTGFFRHLGPYQSETLFMSAQLSQLGVDLREVYRLMNSGQSPENLRLLGSLLERMELHFDGKVVVASEKEGERNELGATSRPTDQLYQLIFSIDSVELIIVLRPENGFTIGGLRSREFVDCGKLASRYGGGGHQRASGFRTMRELDVVKQELLVLASQIIPKNS